MCPVRWAHIVAETFKNAGASLTQQGFVHHKKEIKNKLVKKAGYTLL